jgi:hypothetical protein
MNILGADDLLRLDSRHRAGLAANWHPPGDHRVHRHVHRVARPAFAVLHNVPGALDKAPHPNGRDDGRNRSR